MNNIRRSIVFKTCAYYKINFFYFELTGLNLDRLTNYAEVYPIWQGEFLHQDNAVLMTPFANAENVLYFNRMQATASYQRNLNCHF